MVTLKKTLLYAERQEEQRSKYLETIKDIPKQDLVYIHESGIDQKIIEEGCWAKRGQKIIGERIGKRRTRISILAALNGDKINAPIRFSGTANTDLFLYWVKEFLVPTLEKGQNVIMDNCSIHQSLKVKELI